MRISPGEYDYINVRPGLIPEGETEMQDSVLEMESGVYNIDYFRIRQNARVECLGPCEIRIQTTLLPNANSFVGSADGVNLVPDDIVFFVNGTTCELGSGPDTGAGCDFRAFVSLPNSTLYVFQNSTIQGMVMGESVRINADCVISD